MWPCSTSFCRAAEAVPPLDAQGRKSEAYCAARPYADVCGLADYAFAHPPYEPKLERQAGFAPLSWRYTPTMKQAGPSWP
jgi:hypothetical protein